MAPESSRIAELRRRVQEDPASIAFAQLAEEYRRLGLYDEAVSYCRSGLARHPGYLSARVTLARALIELGAWAEADAELQVVLISAPDNVVALRAMAEVYQHRDDTDRARDYRQRAAGLSGVAPELDDIAGRIDREIAASNKSDDIAAGTEAAPSVSTLLDFDALLVSLGVPNAAPPPLLETVISGETPTIEAAHRASETPDPGPGAVEDAFSALERELRAFEQRNASNTPAASMSEVKISPESDEGLGELEAWLEVLAEERTRIRSAP